MTIELAAYNDYQREITDAWKSKAPPAGSYPANGANVGDSCTINGSAGKLRAIAGHDGWLECRALGNEDYSNDDSITNDDSISRKMRVSPHGRSRTRRIRRSYQPK